MCGISGFNWKDEDRARKMMRSLHHRGPDAQGLFLDDGISLVHNRLSIIDLSSAANQPMHDGSEELVIIFNGEIYNFRELKKELEFSYDFKTKSDTEVILAGYRAWGRGVVDRLNGIFAFAIWDKRIKELFCARDHAGIKPFYYFWDRERFIFASEIKAILEHDVPRRLNTEAFNHYLRVLYVPEPMTMIKNVYKLPPKSTLTLRGKELSVSAYADWKETSIPGSYQEAKMALKEKVTSAVKRQLVSGVPVGIYLSGGIDSSAVLSSMARLNKNTEAFSVGFDLGEGEEGEKFNHDLLLAKKTADHFGAKHNTLLLSGKEALSSLEEVATQCDDPVSNPTSVAMLLLAKFAKKKVSVVLTGSGGDELFGGYDRYRMALLAYYFNKLPEFVRSAATLHPKLAKLEYVNKIDLFAQLMFQKDKSLLQVVSSSFFKDSVFSKKYFEERYLSHYSGDLASVFMKTDQASWLPEYFLMLSDKMSMRSALEERVPFIDRELCAFSDALPRDYKLDLFNTKKILKDAFKEELPEYLFKQPKRGWFSPGAKWLRRPEFIDFAREVFLEEYYFGTSKLFNWPELQEVLNRHVKKEKYNLILLGAILTFQLWAKTYRIEI